jgi:hypothetical protein
LLPQILILKLLFWFKEFEDASACFSMSGQWKKHCKKKGARHDEKSDRSSARSPMLDTPL